MEVIPKILVLRSVDDDQSKGENARDAFCQMSRLGLPFEMIRMIWFPYGCGSALKRLLKKRQLVRLQNRRAVPLIRARALLARGQANNNQARIMVSRNSVEAVVFAIHLVPVLEVSTFCLFPFLSVHGSLVLFCSHLVFQ